MFFFFLFFFLFFLLSLFKELGITGQQTCLRRRRQLTSTFQQKSGIWESLSFRSLTSSSLAIASFCFSSSVAEDDGAAFLLLLLGPWAIRGLYRKETDYQKQKIATDAVFPDREDKARTSSGTAPQKSGISLKRERETTTALMLELSGLPPQAPGLLLWYWGESCRVEGEPAAASA